MLPEGFEWRECRGWRVAVRSDLEGALTGEFELDPDRLTRSGDRTFEGRGRPVLVALPDGTRGVLRRYRHGGLLRRFTGRLFLGAPRPIRELLGTERARRAGVRTPEILGAFVRKVGMLFHEGFLLTREIPGARDLVEVLRSGERAGPALAALGRETRRMHEAGVWHADLHVKNVLATDGEVTLIDFDRARCMDPVPAGMRRANLLRFDRSLVKLALAGVPVPITDRMRFFRAYFDGDAAREERRDLLARCRRSLFWHRLTWGRRP